MITYINITFFRNVMFRQFQRCRLLVLHFNVYSAKSSSSIMGLISWKYSIDQYFYCEGQVLPNILVQWCTKSMQQLCYWCRIASSKRLLQSDVETIQSELCSILLTYCYHMSSQLNHFDRTLYLCELYVKWWSRVQMIRIQEDDQASSLSLVSLPVPWS